MLTDDDLTPEDRFRELAGILAAGILRLPDPAGGRPKNPDENVSNELANSAVTSVTVSAG